MLLFIIKTLHLLTSIPFNLSRLNAVLLVLLCVILLIVLVAIVLLFVFSIVFVVILLSVIVNLALLTNSPVHRIIEILHVFWHLSHAHGLAPLQL